MPWENLEVKLTDLSNQKWCILKQCLIIPHLKMKNLEQVSSQREYEEKTSNVVLSWQTRMCNFNIIYRWVTLKTLSSILTLLLIYRCDFKYFQHVSQCSDLWPSTSASPAGIWSSRYPNISSSYVNAHTPSPSSFSISNSNIQTACYMPCNILGTEKYASDKNGIILAFMKFQS